MKALVHNPYWDSLGGGERYTTSFVKLLLDHGWQVDIQWPSDISSSTKNRFGIDISRAHYVNELKTLNYELLFWLSDGSLPTSFAKKTIIHMQYPFHNDLGRTLVNQIKSKFYKFVVNSQFTKQAIDKEYSVNSTVIYPPIDTSLFIPGKKENIILYIGRFSNLTQLKGQDILIQTFKKLSLPGWKLVLAGGLGVGATPQQFTKLKKMARGSNIEFITNPSFKKIQELCSAAKIFWSASGYSADKATQTEHFGITVVEAMSSGAVPIITNLGGHKEIVDHAQNGYLWDSPHQLENLTLDLINHKSLIINLSKNSITKSKLFDTSRFNAAFTKLI